MKYAVKGFRFPVIFIFLFLMVSCKKHEPKKNAVIRTGIVKDIYATQAVAEGMLTDINDIRILNHGHCWSSANDVPDFRINQGKTLLGPKQNDGSFTSILKNLYPNTTYFLRAFYMTEGDTIYGNDIQQFKTKDTAAAFPPNVATGADSAVSPFGFYVRGVIVNTGNSLITAYGHCFSSINSIPNLTDSITNLGSRNAPGNFNSGITNLTQLTKYYVRAYATNVTGTSYGSVIEVTTPSNATFPQVITNNVFNYDSMGHVFLFGEIKHTGNLQILQYGHVYNKNGDTMPSLAGSFVDNGTSNNPLAYKTQLNITPSPVSTYNYRAFATNSNGTSYGNNYSYTTKFEGAIQVIDPKSTFDFSKAYGGVSATYNKEIYFGLGVIDGNENATFGQWAKYNPGNNIFTKLSDCPAAVAFGNCFVYNNRIYVMAGKINNDYSKASALFSYNPADNTWVQEKSYADALWGASGFLIGNKYYLSCGTTQNSSTTFFLTTTSVLDLNDFTLSTVAALPSDARSNGSGFSINGIGYVLAGMKTFASPVGLAECWQYNPATNAWVQKSDIPLSAGITGIAFGNACTLRGFGYAIGGIQNFAPNLNVSRYDPVADKWEVINAITANQSVSVGVANFVGDKLIYGCGLQNGVGYSTKMFILK